MVATAAAMAAAERAVVATAEATVVVAQAVVRAAAVRVVDRRRSCADTPQLFLRRECRGSTRPPSPAPRMWLARH